MPYVDHKTEKATRDGVNELVRNDRFTNFEDYAAFWRIPKKETPTFSDDVLACEHGEFVVVFEPPSKKPLKDTLDAGYGFLPYNYI